MGTLRGAPPWERPTRAVRERCAHSSLLPWRLPLLADAAAARRFLDAAELVTEATSFGGVHTTIYRRAQWGGDAVPAGFVRFSCGIEDTADLVADLTSALAALG